MSLQNKRSFTGRPVQGVLVTRTVRVSFCRALLKNPNLAKIIFYSGVKGPLAKECLDLCAP